MLVDEGIIDDAKGRIDDNTPRRRRPTRKRGSLRRRLITSSAVSIDKFHADTALALSHNLPNSLKLNTLYCDRTAADMTAAHA